MNRRQVMYWFVYIVKICSVGFIGIPILLTITAYIYTVISGVEPTEYTKSMTAIALCILLGFGLGNWLLGHWPAVNAYYDEIEKDE